MTLVTPARSLQDVADRAGAAPLADLMRVPGTVALHRIICYYVDGRAYHSVATLITTRQGDHTLRVVYDGIFAGRPIQTPISDAAYRALCDVLSKARFDRLSDQPGLNAERLTIWSVERMMGTFRHRTLLSPHNHEPPYSQIINAIDAHLSAAIREVPR